jgi:hypothetical protein
MTAPALASKAEFGNSISYALHQRYFLKQHIILQRKVCFKNGYNSCAHNKMLGKLFLK